MAKIEINKVELVWPGKYNEDGTLKEVPQVKLPFQVIERVNESRASREATKKPQNVSLFDVYEGKEGDTFEKGWKNKLIWGDNLLVMGSLLKKFAGKIDLIYIDPPFATGADFSFTAPIGEPGEDVFKEQTIIEDKAYRDTWGPKGERYPEWIYERLILCQELLSASGSIYIHLDPTVVHMVKVMLDGVFGQSGEKSNNPGFRNEIIWCYSGGGIPKREFPRKHDVILWYTKRSEWTFNTQYRPYSEGTVQRGRTAVKGPNAKLRVEGTPVNDWWPDVKRIASPTDSEKLYFDTQKSEDLLERILKTGSNPADLVADFFCGSGTTCAVAEKLGRRWIGCDLSRWAIHTTRKRLLEIEGAKPFEVLNLGKYERKYWMGTTFGKKGEEQRTLYEYIAFILKLYSAQPLSGMQHLHGKKGKAMVHVGAVDAPVTIDEVNAAIEECLAVNQSELHVLGWEWEMGMSPYIVQEAKRRGIKLLLLNIPREVMEQQAVDKGDIRFFELAHVEIDIKKAEGRRVTVELTDFAFPYADLIPEEVREKITKWSDYVDYWAVDWDFRSDTFMQGWVAYRTRKERKLPLTSDEHTYEKPSTYTIMVKVVDIFGNDTSQTFEVTL